MWREEIIEDYNRLLSTCKMHLLICLQERVKVYSSRKELFPGVRRIFQKEWVGLFAGAEKITGDLVRVFVALTPKQGCTLDSASL